MSLKNMANLERVNNLFPLYKVISKEDLIATLPEVYDDENW